MDVLTIIGNLADALENCFMVNLSWEQLLNVYWFLFFIEFPRYYLLDVVMVAVRKFFYRSYRRKKEVARMKLNLEQPFVSILVPGKDEGPRLYNLLESLGQQTYKNFEVIVIDDGSEDATPLICRDFEKAGLIDKYLRLYPRGGKASAANYGMYFARGKYIVHLDADSSLDRTALEEILLPFYYDDRIKGVGGCVKVRNGNVNLCTHLQQLEYLKSIQVGRMVTNMLGWYHIISGAFGAFDAKTIRNLGCWDIGPGLDGDITQKIRKAGHKVYFAEEAICLTSVPTKWFKLFKQRMRWSKSLVRFRLRKHRDILEPTKNFSFVNFLSNMDGILFDLVFNYLWFFYVIQLIWTNVGNLWEVLLIGWIIRYFFNCTAFLVIMMVSERAREEKKLFLYLPLQTFYMGYFMRLTRLCAHTMELFFHSSYHDEWNPRKTSIAALLDDTKL